MEGTKQGSAVPDLCVRSEAGRRGTWGPLCGAGRAVRTLGCQSWQDEGRPDQDSSRGSEPGPQKRGWVCVGLMGLGGRLDVGSRRCMSRAFRLLQGCGGVGRERSAEPVLPQHPTATVLVSKEHSLEGTYVLLFLGD